MILYDIKNPGGSDTHYQYNKGGIFGGNAAATFNDSTGVSTFTGATITNCAVLGSDSAVFQPNANNTTFFEVNNSDGTHVCSVDTLNRAFVIGEFNAGLDTGLIVYNYGIGSHTAASAFKMQHEFFRFTNITAGIIVTYGYDETHSFGLQENGSPFHRAVMWFDGSGSGGGEGLTFLSPSSAPHFKFISTEPHLTLHNSTHEDSDGGRESRLNFKGEQSGEEETTLARIQASHSGATDDEKGQLQFYTNATADGDTPTLAATIDEDQTLDMESHRLDNLSDINFISATELTISSGAVTLTQGHHNIDTEGDAADDDLDTMNGGESGDIIYILPNDDAHTVRIRHAVGNIYLKHQVETRSYNFSSPSGSSGTFYVAGFFNWNATDANLTQISTTVTHGTANTSEAAHAGLVAGGAGTATGGSGAVTIVVSGTSIDDEGNRSAADSETIVSDITAMSTDEFFTSVKKWLGTITYTLTVGATGHTAYAADFNYGLCKYEDFSNQEFSVTTFEAVGLAGATDTGFNIRLIHYNSADWTYAATGFVPGPTAGDTSDLANMNIDHSTEQNLANGEQFAYKRSDLNTDVAGNVLEGVLIEITTTANKAVESMDIHIGVHTAPNYSYMATTKQHLVFMKHGPNWLEL